MKHLIVLLSLTTLFVSCGKVSSEDIEQDIIKTNYSVVYDQETSQLEASGTFTIGGLNPTYVVLDGTSNLKVNNQSTSFDINLLGQVSYLYKRSIPFNQNVNYQFKYTNRDGDEYVNSINLPSSVSFETPVSIETNQDLVVRWDVSQSSDSATSMSLYIDHENGSLFYSLDESLSNGELEVKSQDLMLYIGQTISIRICRTKSTSQIQHPGEGGSIKSKFCTAKKNVVIQD